jgi:class 3 adenylate cyclase
VTSSSPRHVSGPCATSYRYGYGMETEFKELLRKADGQSRHVIVVFLDVRGFSSFARIAESTDTAEFLKSSYLRILDDYFPDAEFVKPTGDGLLLIYGYSRETLTDAVRQAVDRSISLVTGFPTICDSDPMVNFDVPQRLGIGLSRGSATAIVSDGVPVDYCGRPLNLASRLMDLARPSGLVFDESFGFDLLTDESKARFSEESAYVKGLAEADPLKVYVLQGFTQIPDYNKSPLGKYEPFTEKAETITFKEFCERGPIFRHRLTYAPARPNEIRLHISHPAARSNGSKHPSLTRNRSVAGTFQKAAGEMFARFDYKPLMESLTEARVKAPWPVSLTVEYPVPLGTIENSAA